MAQPLPVKLHDIEVLKHDGRGYTELRRTAVPGGWLYDSLWRAYASSGLLLKLCMSSTFVPDADAEHCKKEAKPGGERTTYTER